VRFDGKEIVYTDLELDLWVWPDRRYLLLDEKEFQEMVVPRLSLEARRQVCAALDELLGDLRGPGRLFQETALP
ncbi:MAG: DUF402 domain-containing protein, partial [Chloroflexia bacterium]